jgi:hypothetical protein
MNREDLLNYYSSIVTEKIYLVHSDQHKLEFKEDLQQVINDKLKTTKVVL